MIHSSFFLLLKEINSLITSCMYIMHSGHSSLPSYFSPFLSSPLLPSARLQIHDYQFCFMVQLVQLYEHWLKAVCWSLVRSPVGSLRLSLFLNLSVANNSTVRGRAPAPSSIHADRPILVSIQSFFFHPPSYFSQEALPLTAGPGMPEGHLFVHQFQMAWSWRVGHRKPM